MSARIVEVSISPEELEQLPESNFEPQLDAALERDVEAFERWAGENNILPLGSKLHKAERAIIKTYIYSKLFPNQEGQSPLAGRTLRLAVG